MRLEETHFLEQLGYAEIMSSGEIQECDAQNPLERIQGVIVQPADSVGTVKCHKCGEVYRQLEENMDRRTSKKLEKESCEQSTEELRGTRRMSVFD